MSDGYVTNQKYITNELGYTAALSLLRTAKDGDASQAVRSLEKAFRSKDRYVRAYETEALTHIRTEEAVDVLFHYYRASCWRPDTNNARHSE